MRPAKPMFHVEHDLACLLNNNIIICKSKYKTAAEGLVFKKQQWFLPFESDIDCKSIPHAGFIRSAAC